MHDRQIWACSLDKFLNRNELLKRSSYPLYVSSKNVWSSRENSESVRYRHFLITFLGYFFVVLDDDSRSTAITVLRLSFKFINSRGSQMINAKSFSSDNDFSSDVKRLFRHLSSESHPKGCDGSMWRTLTINASDHDYSANAKGNCLRIARGFEAPNLCLSFFFLPRRRLFFLSRRRRVMWFFFFFRNNFISLLW